MKEFDINRLDEFYDDYAIVQAKYCLDIIDETEMSNYIEKLAELGQKDAMVKWYKNHSNETNEVIDENFNAFDENDLFYRIIIIDKLLYNESKTELCGLICSTVNEIKELQERHNELKLKLEQIESCEISVTRQEYIDVKLAESATNAYHFNAIDSLHRLYDELLNTPCLKEMSKFIFEFDSIADSCDILDLSYAYSNSLSFINSINYCTERSNNPKHKITLKGKHFSKQRISAKLKSLYHKYPNNLYIALRYANFLRDDKSLLLKTESKKIMQKIATHPLSATLQNYIKGENIEAPLTSTNQATD